MLCDVPHHGHSPDDKSPRRNTHCAGRDKEHEHQRCLLFRNPSCYGGEELEKYDGGGEREREGEGEGSEEEMGIRGRRRR